MIGQLVMIDRRPDSYEYTDDKDPARGIEE
jgi:hypothetical protein